MQHVWKRGFAVIASLGCLSALVSGCATQPSANATKLTGQAETKTAVRPLEGGSIHLDLQKQVQTLDPALADDLSSDEFVRAMYDPLVTYKGSSNQIVSDMATSWTVSKNGTTYTFTLRKGVKFWNGDPVTANSYIAEFERILTKKLASPDASLIEPIVVGSAAYYNGQTSTIRGITAPTPDTLRIKLTKPEPFFLYTLAEKAFVAIDPKWIHQVGNTKFASSAPMGTGAFELASEANNTYVLTKNPHYFMKDKYGQSLPYLNKITYTYQTNPQIEALNFEDGTTPFLGFNTSGIPSSSYQTFIHNPKYKNDFVTSTGGDMWYLGLNVTQAPFTNLKVRQALEYAINKPFIVKLLDGQAAVANQPVPPDAFGYVSKLPASVNYTYNPAKAKALLKASGVHLPIHANFYSSNDATSQKIDTELQSELKAIGIDLNIHSLSWSSYLTSNGTGKEPSFLIDWNQDFPDAYDFLGTLFATKNEPIDDSTMYSNKNVDKWLNQAQFDMNNASRGQLYKQIIIQVMKDATVVPMYDSKLDFIVQPWLHGFYINVNINVDPLSHLWVDASHRG